LEALEVDGLVATPLFTAGDCGKYFFNLISQKLGKSLDGLFFSETPTMFINYLVHFD